MSQYVEIEVSSSMTWTFNALTIINDLLFAYLLHKISKRIPIPFQWEDTDTNAAPIHHSTASNSNAISLRPLAQNHSNKPSIETPLQWNLHPNKCINKCCIALYKLIEPEYPSYFFDDITPDRRKELLENHWQTIQDQTANKGTVPSPSRQSTATYGGKRIFAITAHRMTNIALKKRSCIQYLSLSLRLWSVALGIIALALSWSFWVNMLLEYCIACVFNRGNYAQILGLLAVFAVVHCALWWLKRQWQSLQLLWYNISDHLSVSIGIVWRGCNLLLCLLFTVFSSVNTGVSASDSMFWQLFLRWMVLQGLLWEVGYALLCFCCNIWVLCRLYWTQYNFAFMRTLGKSHLKSIRKTINSVSNLLTQDTIDEEKEPSFERQLSTQQIDDLTRLHQIEATQQNILQSMHSQRVDKSGCDTFLELICALKENEDRNALVCCGTIRKIYIKYLYVLMIFVSIGVCFAVADDDVRSQCSFAGMIFTMYYLIVLFRRGKYNALYCFWSSKYHSRFYANLQIIYSFETQKRMESRALDIDRFEVQNVQQKDDGMSVGLLDADVNPLSMDEAPVMDLSQSDDKTMEHESIQCVQQTDDDKRIIVFRDPNRKCFVHTMCIDYMDFWSMIALDDNDYFGCAVLCGATKELCGLICALLFVMIFVAFTITLSKFGTTHSTSSIYVRDASDTIITPYPMCEVDWAHNYLSLLDMVYVTEVSYWSHKSDVEHMFNLWFGVSGWDFDTIHIESEKPAFFHLRNTDYSVQIVAVRGTYDMNDVLEDISLYTEIATLQTFSWLIPLTTVLPVGFIRDFIQYASIPEGMIDPKSRRRYDEPIYEYVAHNLNASLSQAANPNETIFVMGHSLGGGVAEIVAAKLSDEGYTNVYSFGLSSPGTLWSSSKFGFSVEALDKSSISVLPRRDPVSMVDKHGGVSQVIECDADEIMFCHMATRSFCEIYQECGNELVRNMTFTQCVCGNTTQKAQDWVDCW
eukprot:275418_1